MAVSSLLRSAASTRKKVLAQQDAEYDYQWSNSAKSYEDYQAYQDYLDKRAKASTDPAQNLRLRKTVDSAFRGYTSNEIQRQGINVLEGNATNTDKYNAMYGLYQQAIASGMDDMALGLRLQLDSLDKTIQSEAQASASAAAGASKKAVDATIKANTDSFKVLGDLLGEYGVDGVNEIMKNPEAQGIMVQVNPALADVFAQGGEIGIFDIALGITQTLKDTYANAISQLPPEDAVAYQDKLDALDEKGFKIPGIEGSASGGGVSIQDLQDQVTAVRNGGAAFFRGPDNTLVKGKVTDYTWDKDGKVVNKFANPFSEGEKDSPYNQVIDNFKQSQSYRRDAKGNYINAEGKVVAQYKDGKIFDAKGKMFESEAAMTNALKDSNKDYATLLKEQGFNIQTKDGKTYVTAATTADGKTPAGFESTAPMEVVVDGQGNLRFVKEDPKTGNKELYQVGFDKDGKANVRALKPGEQGAISSEQLGNTSIKNLALLKNTGFSGLNAGNSSLAASNDVIAQGDNFTHGVLADPQKRVEYFNGGIVDPKTGLPDIKKSQEGENAASLNLNPWEKIINTPASAITTVQNAARDKLFTTGAAQQAGTSSVLNNANTIATTKYKYGVLANEQNRQAFAASQAAGARGAQTSYVAPQQTQQALPTPQKFVQDIKNTVNGVKQILKGIKLW